MKRNKSRRQLESMVSGKGKGVFSAAFGSPYPLFANVNFRYVDRIQMDAAISGAVSKYSFSCNGLYDPDITSTGHQPAGYDQWMGTSSSTGFYNHYHVVKSRIKVTAWAQASDNTGQGIMMIGISDDTLTGSDFNTISENPTYKTGTFGGQEAGVSKLTMTHSFDAARQFGITKSSIFAKDDLGGDQTHNPNEQAYYQIVVTGNNVSINPANVCLLVEIEYEAHLSERKEIEGS